MRKMRSFCPHRMAPLKGKPRKVIIVKPLEVPNVPAPTPPVVVPEKVPT